MNISPLDSQYCLYFKIIRPNFEFIGGSIVVGKNIESLQAYYLRQYKKHLQDLRTLINGELNLMETDNQPTCLSFPSSSPALYPPRVSVGKNASESRSGVWPIWRSQQGRHRRRDEHTPINVSAVCFDFRYIDARPTQWLHRKRRWSKTHSTAHLSNKSY